MATSHAGVPASPSAAAVAIDSGGPRTAYAVLAAVSIAHLLNDTIQSLLPAIYPVLKSSFGLSFSQIGLMTLALNGPTKLSLDLWLKTRKRETAWE